MGTVLDLTVEAPDRESALQASQALLRAVDRVELRLSTWRSDSEMSRLNESGIGTQVEISSELEANLGEAFRWWTATGGAFDPGIASLVAAWDLRGSGRVPSGRELETARGQAGMQHLLVGSGTAGRNLRGFGVEEGAFGKGVALREAARAALDEGALCVVIDFGGQVEIRGECTEHEIAIADPGDRSRQLGVLTLAGGSIATSGNGERKKPAGGIPVGHLLDPRTGYPALDWGSVTVVADDAMTADAVATALFVMGPRLGAEWLRERDGLEAVFVDTRRKTPRLTVTDGLRKLLTAVDQWSLYSVDGLTTTWMSNYSD